MPIIHQSEWVDDGDYTGVTQAQTLVSPAIHFWSMEETGTPSVITDIVSGATIASTDITPNAPYVTVNANGVAGNIISGGVAIGTADFMMLVVARSVGTGSDNGHTGFYLERSGDYTYKCHPYYSVVGSQYRTIPYTPNWIRTIGQIYTHATVKRGNYLEHYCLPKGFVDALDISDFYDSDSGHFDMAAPLTTSMGHGGYGTPALGGAGRDIGIAQAWSSSGDVAQDYAGVAVYKFDNGAPCKEEVVKCMRWSEDKWTAGDKRLYPGLSK